MKALLTGSSRGIGFAITKQLLNNDIELTGTSTSDKTPIDHKLYTHLKCDLSSEEDISALTEYLEKYIPDVVINNAGIFEDADIESDESSWLENWDRTMQINLRAPALLSQKAVQTWIRHDIKGRLINISSRAAYRGDTQEYSSYAASKAGLVAFTKSLARDLGKKNITAYNIAPGFVHTDMAENSIEIYGKDYLTKGLALDEIVPPEQVGELVHFIATANITHMTGQTFHINTGSYVL